MWVLVIDDAVSNTLLITEALKSLHHHAVVSHDPGSALALLDQMAFDCIIVDYHMPHMSGSAFLASLHDKNSPSSMMAPVIVTTADPSPGLVREVKSLGARTVLPKPLSATALDSALRSL